MSEIISHINPNNPEYQANFKHNKALAEELDERQKLVATATATADHSAPAGPRQAAG